MLKKQLVKNSDFLMYVKINDFVIYTYKTLNCLPKKVKYNSGNDLLLKLFDSNIVINKLIKVGKDKKMQYCYKIEGNLKNSLNILKCLFEEKHIKYEKYVIMSNYINEICALNGGYIKYLLVNGFG